MGVRGTDRLLFCPADRMFEAKVSKIVVVMVVSKAGQGGVSIVDADLRFGARPSLGGWTVDRPESRVSGES